MTPEERVRQAIAHQETDYLPYTIDFCRDAFEKAVKHLHDGSILAKINNHIVRTGPIGFPRNKQISKSIWQDAFGVQWDTSVDNDFGIPVSPVFTEATFDEYEFPDPDNPGLYSHFPEFVEKNNDKFKIARIGMAYFERLWALYGMENALMDMASNEKFILKVLDKILEFNLKLIGQYLKYDIDCIHINDDYGQQKGLIMGPALWRKFFKPGLRTMAERIKSGKKYVYLHSCGDLAEIIPDLIEIGVDIHNPFQPEAMNVYGIKKEYGKYLTFHGGISEQKTLAMGTPDNVERETREKILRLGEGGGYILAPSQAITRDVPVENIERFIDIVVSI